MILVTMVSLSVIQLCWQPCCEVTAWPIIFCCPLFLGHSKEMILELLDYHGGVPFNVQYAATIHIYKFFFINQQMHNI
jgi:hypothetical protein